MPVWVWIVGAAVLVIAAGVVSWPPRRRTDATERTG